VIKGTKPSWSEPPRRSTHGLRAHTSLRGTVIQKFEDDRPARRSRSVPSVDVKSCLQGSLRPDENDSPSGHNNTLQPGGALRLNEIAQKLHNTDMNVRGIAAVMIHVPDWKEVLTGIRRLSRRLKESAYQNLTSNVLN
jgi:hypothetical protein